MKALIMVAGKGSRISPKIGQIPKSVLPTLKGEPMIRRNVRMMLEAGITPVLCLGYQGKKIQEALEGLPVKYYENPFYGVTNNVASLWFALDELNGEEDILLLSGDLYYPMEFLQKAQQAKGALTMFGDSSRIEDGDFYLHRDELGMIDHYGPKLERSLRQYEYMGFSCVRADKVLAFAQNIREYVEQERYDTYFEDVVISFSKQTGCRIDVVDVAGSFWREFDFYEDYERVLAYERENDVLQSNTI